MTDIKELKPTVLVVGAFGYQWEDDFNHLMRSWNSKLPFGALISDDEILVRNFAEKSRIPFTLAKRENGWFRKVSFEEQNENLLKTYKPNFVIIFGDQEIDMNMIQVAEKNKIPYMRPEVTKGYVEKRKKLLRESYNTYEKAYQDLQLNYGAGAATARLALEYIDKQERILKKIHLLNEICYYRPHSNEFAVIVEDPKKETNDRQN